MPASGTAHSCHLCSVQGDVEIKGVEKATVSTNNVETPSTPVLSAPIILLAQLGNSFSRFQLGHLEVRHLDAHVVQKRFMTVHKVKVAAHLRLAGEEELGRGF
jgi:hypothetical protein